MKKSRPLNEIAAEIKSDWGGRMNKASAPYVAAMETLKTIDEDYGPESAVEIVARFLTVSNAWRGQTARRVKAELDALLKTRGAN